MLAELAARITAARRARPPRLIRGERFGAIAQLGWPRALVFVDRALAGRLGMTDHARWGPASEGCPAGYAGRAAPDDPAIGDAPLSAPLEAHLQLTNRCDVGCQGCYTGATPQGGPRELGRDEWMRAIDHLAELGVFHLALGGGESATLPWLGDIAAHARSRGLVPNLTTSGLAGLDNLLPIADRFGQINVSLDGLGETYRAVRGVDGFAAADRALIALRERKREIGINVVVTRHNFGQLDAIFAHARRRRLNEVELLRFKPSGRGAATYAGVRCTDAQHRAFLPTILAGARRHRIRARVDCSYTPMLAHHRPDRALLAGLAVYGCVGGDFLIGARATGVALACSFAAPPADRPQVDALKDYWDRPDAFGDFRGWRDAAEPCSSCDYHALCRGGCRVVAAHAGEARGPDPECPRVVDHRASGVAPRGVHRLAVIA